MENSLTFWDKKGNPIITIVSQDDSITSEYLDELFSVACIDILRKKGYKVECTTEEFSKLKQEV